MNKKSIIVSIVSVILIVIAVVAATYAFLMFITNEEELGTGSGKLDIVYQKPDDLIGEDITLSSSDNREGGLMTTGSARLNTGSEVALFNMYITPTDLSDNLKMAALKWEAEGLRDTDGDGIDEVVCSNNGDFSKAVVDTKISVIEGCELSTDDTTFNIYIWLDYNDTSYVPVGVASFGAKISADSVPITGGF